MGVDRMLTGEKAKLADLLWELGAVEVGEHALKRNETDPSALFSNVYFNLRTPDHPTKPGPITQDALELIARLFTNLVIIEDIHFDRIAGLPEAGNPLAGALADELDFHRVTIRLAKHYDKRSRRTIRGIESGDFEPGEIVLLADDVITGGDSKMEAIAALYTHRLVVNDLLVCVDRRHKVSTRVPCRLHAIFELPDILGHYLDTDRISEEYYHKVLDEEWLKN